MMRVTVRKASSLNKTLTLVMTFEKLLHYSIKRVKGGSKEQLLYRIVKSKLGCGTEWLKADLH
jgi:hypothetical protein